VPGYRDLRPVGRGGFSVVYRAYQEQLHRVVALKVLSVEFIDAPVRRRFLREVKLTSRLADHPHVVTVLDSGLTDTGRPYLAMEFFERGSLRDRLAAEGPLPVAEVLRIGVKICAALAAAHADGLLHRDVKPQNILISRYGEPALADFGTARLTDAMDVSARTEALTPYHAAPEILQGLNPTPACDVYSLGSTLFQLLSGRPPYQSDEGGIAALLLRILRDEPPPLTRRDVPDPLVSALHRALAKDPADRWPAAAAFAEALRRIQTELGLPATEIGAAPPPAPEPSPVSVQIPLPAAVSRAIAPPPVPAAPPLVEPPPRLEAPPRPIGGGEETTEPSPADLPTVSPRRRRRPVVVGLVALVIVAAALPILLQLRHRPATVDPVAATTTTPAIATPTTAAVDLAAARPYGMSYVDGGASVVLHWKLPAGSDRYNVLVQYDPGGRPMLLSPGLTTYTVTGLSPATGYCFSIGLLLALGHDDVPPVEAWSVPACIRGAVAVTPR
jgi:tRNA A-37 threonylcarbamoyl transferase component Bud32